MRPSTRAYTVLEVGPEDHDDHDDKTLLGGRFCPINRCQRAEHPFAEYPFAEAAITSRRRILVSSSLTDTYYCDHIPLLITHLEDNHDGNFARRMPAHPPRELFEQRVGTNG